MSRFMRNGFMASMGAIIVGGLFISFWQDADGVLDSVKKQLGLSASGEPVLIIFVANAGAVASVRAAVADERVVAESPDAFALREGRIIAAGRDAAGDIVSAAGWVDRELKLVHVAKKTRATQTAEADTDGGLPPGKMAELLAKDTLTYVEAAMLLDHI